MWFSHPWSGYFQSFYQCWGRVWRPHLVLEPAPSLPQGLKMVPIKDRMGTRIAISRKAWAWALEASPSPFGLLIPSLLLPIQRLQE